MSFFAAQGVSSKTFKCILSSIDESIIFDSDAAVNINNKFNPPKGLKYFPYTSATQEGL